MDQKKQVEYKNKWAHVVAKAWGDPTFKQKLFANSEEVLKEYELTYQGKTCSIVEEKPNEIILIFPPMPEGNLSEAELNKITAGGCAGCTASM